MNIAINPNALLPGTTPIIGLHPRHAVVTRMLLVALLVVVATFLLLSGARSATAPSTSFDGVNQAPVSSIEVLSTMASGR